MGADRLNLPGTRRDFLFACAAGLGAILRNDTSAADPEKPKPGSIPRFRVIPQPDSEVSFARDRTEQLRWHFGSQYPRPFFFPLLGPSGVSLTRMGHPGAPNHDHHRSVWFAHHSIEGIDFWSERGGGRVRQKQWLCYVDGPEECKMAVSLGWYGTEPERELMEQTLIAVFRSAESGDNFLELQSTFRAVKEPVRLGKTNFGFLAVRVAKSISEYFGGGRLTDSEGRTGERQIFGSRAAWMDYSGPVSDRIVEGITYFDHPDNPDFPTHWHVREDGWMGASFCMQKERLIPPEEPLQLRYLLHAHGGPADRNAAERILKEFSVAPSYRVRPSKKKHTQFELQAMRYSERAEWKSRSAGVVPPLGRVQV